MKKLATLQITLLLLIPFSSLSGCATAPTPEQIMAYRAVAMQGVQDYKTIKRLH